MASKNKLTLSGNLVSDAKVKDLNEKTKLSEFTLAVDHPHKEGAEKRTSFMDVKAFNNDVANGLKKGQKVELDGYLTQDRWEKEGKKHEALRIVAMDVKVMERANTREDRD